TRSAVRRERLGHIELAAPVAHIWYTRRVPSYLGMLLNVSRRNLDRVLYFAQYVITFVDDEARKRALKRIEEELKEEEAKLEQEIKAKAGDSNAAPLIAQERLRADFEVLKEVFDDKLATMIDQIVKEAKTIETRLGNLMG
ncbi:unnamed protein product, partial [Darwinula stevensoni]